MMHSNHLHKHWFGEFYSQDVINVLQSSSFKLSCWVVIFFLLFIAREVPHLISIDRQEKMLNVHVVFI